jgi:hypothetical protein
VVPGVRLKLICYYLLTGADDAIYHFAFFYSPPSVTQRNYSQLIEDCRVE